jgi:hypothetical protein
MKPWIVLGPSEVLGNVCFFVGFMMVEHGWNIGPVRVSVLSSLIIDLTFSLWIGFRYFSLKLGKPLKLYQSIVLWSILLVASTVAWELIGYGLMYYAENTTNITAIEATLQAYEKYAIVTDLTLMIPIIMIMYAFAKGLWGVRKHVST